MSAASFFSVKPASTRQPTYAFAWLFFVALLLLAQQSAHLHFLSDAARGHQVTGSLAPDADTEADPLCDLHTVLQGVLGLPEHFAPRFVAEAPRYAPVPLTWLSAVVWSALPPASTGPPALP